MLAQTLLGMNMVPVMSGRDLYASVQNVTNVFSLYTLVIHKTKPGCQLAVTGSYQFQYTTDRNNVRQNQAADLSCWFGECT